MNPSEGYDAFLGGLDLNTLLDRYRKVFTGIILKVYF